MVVGTSLVASVPCNFVGSFVYRMCDMGQADMAEELGMDDFQFATKEYVSGIKQQPWCALQYNPHAGWGRSSKPPDRWPCVRCRSVVCEPRRRGVVGYYCTSKYILTKHT